MARMYKSTYDVKKFVKLTTVFEDHEADHTFTIGDVIENLRYVSDGEIKIDSGRVTAIGFKINSPIKLDLKNPTNTLPEDMTLTEIQLDTSKQYNASSAIIPLREIVEFEDEKDQNVVRMKYSPYFVCDMQLHYSDYKVQNASIEVGDVFDHVRIMNPNTPGEDITGKFEVLSFVYVCPKNEINVIGLALKNVDTGEIVVVEFKQIFALHEVFNHEITDQAALAEVLTKLAPGDTVVVSTVVDTANSPIEITQQDITLDLAADLQTDGGRTSGIHVVSGGKMTITGNGTIVNTTPYDAAHSSGVVRVEGNGELVFNGGAVSAVIADDPVNKGQFGVCVFEQGKVTVNEGDFNTGWYCISGNGMAANKGSVITINGGTFASVSDYAIYHPQDGELIINGGVIKGAAGAIAANNGKITINGGEFSVLGGGDTGNFGDGTSGLSNVAINLNAKYGDVVCRITGGKFYATAAGTIMIATGSAHNVDLKISGGKFTSKPNEEWLEEGYLVTGEPDEEGFYTVYKALQ